MSKTKEELAQIHKDLLCSAFEGGSNYWYFIEKVEYPRGKKRADFEYPHLEVPFLEGGRIIIRAEDHSNKNHPKGHWTLDQAAIARGWKLMIEEHPRHYADAMEDGDATTGDVFLQLCLFGEVIFG